MFTDNIAYCGVDCHECIDYEKGVCPGCRNTEWREDDACPIAECCLKRGANDCGECEAFPCEMMQGFFKESESHRRALLRLRGEELPPCHPSLLRLSAFDGKRIRLTEKGGRVFEGIASHDSADYCEHEYGVREEGISLSHLLFYSGDIEKAEAIDEFSAPFGLLEEEIVSDGDLLTDALSDEETEHVLRLLRCMAAHLRRGESLPDESGVKHELRMIIKYSHEDALRGTAAAVLEMLPR